MVPFNIPKNIKCYQVPSSKNLFHTNTLYFYFISQWAEHVLKVSWNVILITVFNRINTIPFFPISDWINVIPVYFSLLTRTGFIESKIFLYNYKGHISFWRDRIKRNHKKTCSDQNHFSFSESDTNDLQSYVIASCKKPISFTNSSYIFFL